MNSEAEQPITIKRTTPIIIPLALLVGICSALALGGWSTRGLVTEISSLRTEVSALTARLDAADASTQTSASALRDISIAVEDIRRNTSLDRYTASMARRAWSELGARNPNLNMPDINEIIRSGWVSIGLGATEPGARPWRD